MTLLSESEINSKITSMPEWSHDGSAICREFDRGDFVGAVAFVDSLVVPAEEMGHHPDVSISWSKVTVRISTHSQGGITDADFELAGRIDKLA